MAARVTVGLEVVEHETGLWCDACALPSVHRAAVVVTVAGRMRLQVESRCTDCGQRGAVS